MKSEYLFISLAVLIAAAPVSADPVGDLMDNYRAEGAGPFDADAGRDLWHRDFAGKSCTSCHGSDLTSPGRHARTGKNIAPLAPSANPDRLTDASEIAKWLLRNCKWTLGRECTTQEKGDILSWLRQQ